MQIPLSFKIEEAVKARLEEEATAKKVTVSDIIRWSIDAYFAGEGARVQNMRLLMAEIASIKYEVVKNRVLALYLHDPDGTMITEKEMTDADTNAKAYIEGKNGKEEHGRTHE